MIRLSRRSSVRLVSGIVIVVSASPMLASAQKPPLSIDEAAGEPRTASRDWVAPVPGQFAPFTVF
jgi:hypothetical protein